MESTSKIEPQRNTLQGDAETPPVEHALESHDVVQLEAFLDRKEWIGDKIKFLESLPPIEVFAGVDTWADQDFRKPPSAEELKSWLLHHDQIEKEIEQFDAGDMLKLKKFAKAAANRNLSPEDTDLIELTLTTLLALDKLLHLLRVRSENLEILGLRINWETLWLEGWKEMQTISTDVQQFLQTRARWDPAHYTSASQSQSSIPDSQELIKSPQSNSDSLPSRGTRFHIAEGLTHEAGQIASRLNFLKHNKIFPSGKVLDKLIEKSRTPVPDRLLDDQDRLEDQGLKEMENVGKFVMSVVMQWKMADELYYTFKKDSSIARALIAEIASASAQHPNSRLGTSLLARARALAQRHNPKNDPADINSTFPRPKHALYQEQDQYNQSLTRLLSAEMAATIKLAEQAEFKATQYLAGVDLVKRADSLSSRTHQIMSQIDGLLLQATNGIPSGDADGTPPNLSSLECLEPSEHAAYIQHLPRLVLGLEKVVAEAKSVIQESHSLIPLLHRPGINVQFQKDFTRRCEDLDSTCHRVERCCSESTSKVRKLQAFREIWQNLLSSASDIESLREDVNRTMGTLPRPAAPHGAPATPPPEISTLHEPCDDPQLPPTIDSRLSALRSTFLAKVTIPLKNSLSSSSDELLYRHLRTNHAIVQGRLDDVHDLAELSERIRNQTYIVGIIHEESETLDTRVSSLVTDLDQEVKQILDIPSHISGHDECDVCLADFARRTQSLTGDIGTFIQTLASRVPFVSSDPKRSRSGSQVFTQADADEMGSGSLPPISSEVPPLDPLAVDQSVRDEMNVLSIRLTSCASTLEQKLDHLRNVLMFRRLGLHAETLDVSWNVAKVALDECQAKAFKLLPGPLGGPPELGQVREDLDVLEQTWEGNLGGQLDVIKEVFKLLDLNRLDDDTRSRAQKLLANAESHWTSFHEMVLSIRTHISGVETESERLEAERLRLLAEAEEARRKEEELLAEQARQAERLAAEEAKRREEEELEAERVRQAEILAAAEEEERLREAEKAEAEARALSLMALEEASVGQSQEGPATISQVLSSGLVENSLVEDVFQPGSHSESNSSRDVSDPHEEILKTIQGLRMELLDLDINKVARRSTATLQDSFPPPLFSAQATEKLENIAERAEVIDHIKLQDSKVDAAFTSLKYEIDSSRVLLERLDGLKEFAKLVEQCDTALSDQIDLIDRFPRASSESYSGDDFDSLDESLTPEHLSRGLTITSDTIQMMDKAAAQYLDDVRVRNEHQRLHQTWSEIEEMVKELLTMERSRPSSTISFGRASDVSANSERSVPRSGSKPRVLGVRRATQGFLVPPLPKTQRSVSGSSDTPTRFRERSFARSVSGPSVNAQSRLYSSTASSRARTTSLSSDTHTPTKGILPPSTKRTMTPVRPRPRVTSTSTRGRLSPAFSERSMISQVPGTPSKSPPPKGTFSRAPRMSFGQKLVPYKSDQVKKTYVSNPRSKLDVAVGNVVNKLPVDITVSPVEEGWKDRSGKYWIGDEDAKLCFCRILRSQTVMVRVGGGWVELSKFIQDHFADLFRLIPSVALEQPRPSKEEHWISAATLAASALSESTGSRPHTPEFKTSTIPSFALSTPSNKSPRSVDSSPGSPSSLTPLQFIRRADDTESIRPTSPPRIVRSGRSSLANTPIRMAVWRP
ncbi:hypothetical protein SISSUDRAFT_1126688 [Sistotremastrum suecicum HHB10207 ss-3]|uniref:GAR domain-containing protein n=1 Tax=Sistotremastrum suecicum HHB10207 ss-3 TaxID=1314776 RepID=A0A166FYB1_9AGAM|nr:hypothetical protein SISSUDRAFT_1126688 [Sistotremastrum suecicum HHB10207 ss-3]